MSHASVRIGSSLSSTCQIRAHGFSVSESPVRVHGMPGPRRQAPARSQPLTASDAPRDVSSPSTPSTSSYRLLRDGQSPRDVSSPSTPSTSSYRLLRDGQSPRDVSSPSTPRRLTASLPPTPHRLAAIYAYRLLRRLIRLNASNASSPPTPHCLLRLFAFYASPPSTPFVLTRHAIVRRQRAGTRAWPVYAAPTAQRCAARPRAHSAAPAPHDNERISLLAPPSCPRHTAQLLLRIPPAAPGPRRRTGRP